MLHVAETWAMTTNTLNCLRCNDHTMICNIKARYEISSDSLLTKLAIFDTDVVLHLIRVRWHGHVEGSSGLIARTCKLVVIKQKIHSRLKKTWEVVRN